MQPDLDQPALFLLEPSPSSLAAVFLQAAFFVMVADELLVRTAMERAQKGMRGRCEEEEEGSRIFY